MISMPAAGPLAVAETDRIAALLADIAGPNAPSPEPRETPAVHGSAPQMLGPANRRNESPGPIETPATERLPIPGPAPLPAPFGVLTVGALFAMVNWRNRFEEIRPLPTIKPPSPPETAFTVEEVMSTFGWE